MEPDSVIFECKERALLRLANSNERLRVGRVEHEDDGILNVEKNEVFGSSARLLWGLKD